MQIIDPVFWSGNFSSNWISTSIQFRISLSGSNIFIFLKYDIFISDKLRYLVKLAPPIGEFPSWLLLCPRPSLRSSRGLPSQPRLNCRDGVVFGNKSFYTFYFLVSLTNWGLGLEQGLIIGWEEDLCSPVRVDLVWFPSGQCQIAQSQTGPHSTINPVERSLSSTSTRWTEDINGVQPTAAVRTLGSWKIKQKEQKVRNIVQIVKRLVNCHLKNFTAAGIVGPAVIQYVLLKLV